MRALATLVTRHQVTPRRRTRTARLQLPARRDARQALRVAMTIPAFALPIPAQAPAGWQSRRR